MKTHQKVSLAFVMIVILAGTLSSSALSQVDAQSWIKRRLTRNAGDSHAAHVAATANDVYAVWHDDTKGNYEIYFRRSSDKGVTWGRTKRLTHNAGDSRGPDIAVSGSDIHVVWFDDSPGNPEIYYKRSSDNGVTWSVAVRLTHSAGDSYFPRIAVSGSSTHVVWHDNTPGNSEIYYRRSTDNGANWGGKKRLTRNSGGSSLADIAVSGSNIHVVWQDLTPGDWEIFYKRSTNNGTSWGRTKHLTSNAGTSFVPTIDVSGNNIHVAWSDNTPGNYEIFYRRSINNGGAWGKKKRLTKTPSGTSHPVVSAWSSDVYVLWQDTAPGNSDIFYKFSNDDGANWSKKKRLVRNKGNSKEPDADLFGGQLHVVWVDDTPGNNEVFYKRGP
jgi:hypothetical protein